ncbi:MAG: hypothetical protein AAGM38_11105 [Pseudomonadota bacterium]
MFKLEAIRLGPNEKTPDERDLIAELQMDRSGMWTSTIVAGLLFKEDVPGGFHTAEEAIEGTKKFLSGSRRSRFYYRQKRAGRRVIKRRRSSLV